MKTRITKKVLTFIFALLFLFIGFTAVNTAVAEEYESDGASAELSLVLDNLNVRVAGETEGFIASLSALYNVGESDLRRDHLEGGMHAGDLYMAARLSNMTDSSYSYIVKLFLSNRDNGWGLVAKSLGIQPGSVEFYELKDTNRVMDN